MEEIIGIYKITNILNNLIYIGQSVNIYKRWSNHRYSGFNVNSREYNIPLYRDFRKYGLENFKFEIVEKCSKDELNEKEQYWIEYYDSFFNGYNESVGGSVHCRQSNITKEKIIGVINDLKNTDMKHIGIAEKWDISIEMVQGINTGRYWKHNITYPIQNTKNQREIYGYKCKICNKDFETYDKDQIYCSHECSSLGQRKAQRPPKEELFELIKTTSFVKLGEMYGVSDNAVRKWCKTYGLPYKQKDIKALQTN